MAWARSANGGLRWKIFKPWPIPNQWKSSNQIAVPLTSMLRTLLTSFESQPGRVVDEVNSKVAGGTGSNNGNGSIRNFQSFNHWMHRKI